MAGIVHVLIGGGWIYNCFAGERIYEGVRYTGGFFPISIYTATGIFSLGILLILLDRFAVYVLCLELLWISYGLFGMFVRIWEAGNQAVIVKGTLVFMLLTMFTLQFMILAIGVGIKRILLNRIRLWVSLATPLCCWIFEASITTMTQGVLPVFSFEQMTIPGMLLLFALMILLRIWYRARRETQRLAGYHTHFIVGIMEGGL